MKILHVININGFGGAEKLLLQLLPALKKNDEVECAILHPVNTDVAALSISAVLERKGIKVYLYSYKKWYSKGIMGYLSLLISNGKYTIVHSHLKHADVWMARLKKRKAITIPVVSTMHGYNDAYENKFGFEIKRKIYFSPYFQFSRIIYTYLDGFILVSDIVNSFFSRTGLLGNKRKVTIHHGYERQAHSFNNPGNKHDGGYHIALPGRLIYRKGHRFLIEAVRLLNDKGVSVNLHIYGTGEEQPVLETQVKKLQLQEKVTFHGYVDDLVSVLAGMDSVVIPSLWEGFGLVFLDAFAAHTPVVAFDLPAANEIIKHEYNGLLARPGSSADLAENIARVLKDDQLRNRIIANADIDLIQRFDMNIVADKYRDFYKEISG